MASVHYDSAINNTDFVLSIASNFSNSTADEDVGAPGPPGPPVSTLGIVFVTALLCVIELVGIIGNNMVLLAIFCDNQMRKSVTNLFIANLAAADLVIMLFGVPEIVMFAMNRGWLLGRFCCHFNRFMQVTGLYVSIQSLVALCIERHIAIAHPIQAHTLSSRKRTVLVICGIWLMACLCGLPTALFIDVMPVPNAPISFCRMHLPLSYLKLFKYTEFVLFYLLPLLVQAILYTITCKKLFSGVQQLHRKQTVKNDSGMELEKSSVAIRARCGVVKMLIASVVIYFVSYSPHQVLLFYNTFSQRPFRATWVYVAFVTAIAYSNSAANPILYSIFSQNFRRRFLYVLFRMTPDKRVKTTKTGTSECQTGGSTRGSRHASKSASTAL